MVLVFEIHGIQKAGGSLKAVRLGVNGGCSSVSRRLSGHLYVQMEVLGASDFSTKPLPLRVNTLICRDGQQHF